jgi:endonuclease/exonuclease/phosphatase family metal-dependent hydrolase
MARNGFRVASFNVENLFARYRFRTNFEPREADGFTVNNLAFEIYEETEKRITARAIQAVDADVLALQEVESLPVLDRFCRQYLASMGYAHRILVDGNDPRQIDVAVLSRLPLANLRTHRHERDADGQLLFSRDLLEVDVDVRGKPLTLYLSHLKSMLGGRDETHARRAEQAARIAAVLDAAEKPRGYKGNFIVLGDFNDYPDEESALTPLLGHQELVNVVERLPKAERWTHYYARGKKGEKTNQLDYLLLGRALDTRAKKPAPQILRQGLPWRAAAYEGERFEGVGEDNPKASDHCPLSVDIPFAALA